MKRTIVSGFRRVPAVAAAAVRPPTMAGEDPFTTDRLTRESSASDYRFPDARQGVVPGYAGHLPGSKQSAHFKTPYGGIAAVGGGQRVREPVGGTRGMMLGQGPRGREARETTSWRELGTDWKPADTTKVHSQNQRYLEASGGVKLGYSGFVPHARRHFGSMSKGRVDGQEGAHQQSASASRTAAAQGASTIEGGGNTGTLLLPSMVSEIEGTPPPKPPTPQFGGAVIGYGGHRPRYTFEDGHGRRVESYKGSPMLAERTPFRRGHRELTSKVGLSRRLEQEQRPRTALTPRTPPSRDEHGRVHGDSDGDGVADSAGTLDAFLARSTRMKGVVVNDWQVHQRQPPPPVPDDSRAYRLGAGGIVPGWAGRVPRSAEHFGSSHVGMRSHPSATQRPRSAGAQRGHVGKTAGGALFREHDDNQTSVLAADAVIGYAGHLPRAQHAFGVSPWASPSKRGGTLAPDAAEYSA